MTTKKTTSKGAKCSQGAKKSACNLLCKPEAPEKVVSLAKAKKKAKSKKSLLGRLKALASKLLRR